MDYTIRSGDTLLGIAIRYGLDWQDIALANAIGEGDLLQIGQELRLPGIGGIGGAAAEVASGGLLYTVNSGDTLVGIASTYEIAWEDIAAANGLGEYSVLQIGMQLRLPGVADSEQSNSEQSDSERSDSERSDSEQSDSEQSDSEQSDSASSDGLDSEKAQTGDEPTGATESEFVEKRPSPRQYTVKPGDTLFSIASRNGLIWEDLAEFNQLDEDGLLSIGQTLLIPDDDEPTDDATSTAVTASQDRQTQPIITPAERSYTVRPGDTIVAIALRLDADWRELLRINGLNEFSILQPGQTILVE
jgi:LysM repeat protein